jgi:hypothetical protein
MRSKELASDLVTARSECVLCVKAKLAPTASKQCLGLCAAFIASNELDVEPLKHLLLEVNAGRINHASWSLTLFSSLR